METKFISLDKKESYYEKVDMPARVVFYPYFHYRNANSAVISKDGPASTESDRAFRARLALENFSAGKLSSLEKTLCPDRIDEYGFWTGEYDGSYYIGLGAGSLDKFMEQEGRLKASYAILKGANLLFIAELERDALEYKKASLDIYFSPPDGFYSKMLPEVSAALEESGLYSGGIMVGEANYSAVKYVYSGANAAKFKSGKHVFLPSQEKLPFKEHVESCTWHTVVVNDDVVNDGPRFVLLKNSGKKLGNILDSLSGWLVHRRGGFVTGKEFSEGDFHQDTNYIIKEIDEYMFEDLVLLNIECDTYSKNFDAGFENFLANLSESRFSK